MSWYEDKKKTGKVLTKSIWEIMGDRADADQCIHCSEPLFKNPSPDAYMCNGCYKTAQHNQKELKSYWAKRLAKKQQS